MKVFWLALSGCLGLSQAAQARVFRYTDAAGIVHITNIAPRSALAESELYDPIIESAAAYYLLPSCLIKAVIAVESNFDAQALSQAGAQGLMQLLPSTAESMFVSRPYDPAESIYGGTRYLRILANRFAGDVSLALAAYHCGPGPVARAGKIPAIATTQAYVRRVLTLYHHYANEGAEVRR